MELLICDVNSMLSKCSVTMLADMLADIGSRQILDSKAAAVSIYLTFSSNAV